MSKNDKKISQLGKIFFFFCLSLILIISIGRERPIVSEEDRSNYEKFLKYFYLIAIFVTHSLRLRN